MRQKRSFSGASATSSAKRSAWASVLSSRERNCRAGRAPRQAFGEGLAELLVRALLADRALDDVERVHARGAVPDHAEMGVAHQPRVGPVLDVAVAAARLHRRRGDGDIVARGAVLPDRRQEADHLGRHGILRPGHRRRGQHQGRQRLLGLDHHLQQLAAHQRMVDHRLAEGVAVTRHLQGFVQAAPHHAGGTRQVRHPAGIDHLEHLLQAAIERAQMPATAPSKTISPLGIDLLPSLSLSRTIR